LNHTCAFIHETPGGNFLAMVRLPMDARARPVLGKGGEPKRFPSAYEAQKAATDCITSWINGHLVRDGEIMQTPRQAAEKLFGGQK